MNSTDWIPALFSNIDAKDTARFLDFLTDDAEFRFGNAPAVVGKPAIGAAVDGFFASIRGSRHDLVRSWAPQGHCICQGSVSYARLDGSSVTVPFVNVLGMRDSLINDYRIYIDLSPLYA